MTQATADTLRKAKALISDPENWNKDGDYFKDGDPDTGCMCVFGALSLAMRTDEGVAHTQDVIIHNASRDLFDMEPIKLNDHPNTTHADIMALFDRAIELTETEEE